ncbi:cytidylate kinase [Desulfocapsa sulfexigens DSM 10523]|uniref:Cytidylate kinase n=1 Tax=Desulfocapsa sulfexigens (strain DSM 10523 / SB164P1) TaxID=1167006 RepID=M1P7H5_DESSD|nr:(d)CMP kinase [Desulfocapsa sulfexigens]AGF77647.1 cytidylate kinase [Desulfocapsa sulfexigens DSM 10523]
MFPSHKQEVVTIDGPSGVGKSTISRRIASSLSFTYLDTGAMYRAVGLKLKNDNIDLGDEGAVRESLMNVSLQLLPANQGSEDVGVLLDGDDVSQEIRSPEMAMVASAVSAIPAVRQKLTVMQQEIGKKGRIVAEGRDIGTVVFPNAAWKFYLDAAPEIRMQRRADQLRLQGKQVDEEKLLAMIVKRDHDDQNRTIAPLCKAEDAHTIDTGVLTIDGVVEAMLREISRHSV